MSKESDKVQLDDIEADVVAKALYDALMKMPMERRLYPELYSHELSEVARAAVREETVRALDAVGKDLDNL